MTLESLVISRTHRVPVQGAPGGDGAAAARQFDAVLMTAGFKLSGELLGKLSQADPGQVAGLAMRVIATVREMAGGHVQHNPYFMNFPQGVPDTVEFWMSCLREALLAGADVTGVMTPAGPVVNLLSLPRYGTYQHTYTAMLAAHPGLIEAAGDRVTVLHAGGTLEQESSALYLSLAGSPAPLNDADKAAVTLLARACADGPQPGQIPVRETRALINMVRLENGAPLLAGTVTDVLRLAVALSGGDVSLAVPSRLGPFTRPQRRALLAALDTVAAGVTAKLADVHRHTEQWKRLGERLHPHEHPYPRAAEVFAVARGERAAPTLAARAERRFAAGDTRGAALILGEAPGMLFRALDRLLRSAGDRSPLLATVRDAAGGVSGRVLLSAREHAQNRGRKPGSSRVFAGQGARAWVTQDTREPLDGGTLADLTSILDDAIRRRLDVPARLVVDPAVLGVAVPLTGKGAPSGLGVLPRGSVSDVGGGLLRFFAYWRQAGYPTDYDLSALLVDADYGRAEHVSWTNYSAGGYATYSGDVTDAADGATEFIDIQLPKVTGRFIIPQLHVFDGEPFTVVAEAFFGFMTRGAEQLGRPFEPRTVRFKSDLGGRGRIALPVVFMRGDDGRWRAKWLHLYLRGQPSFNTVEGNRVTTGMLVRGVVERDYLRVGYLVDQMRAAGADVTPAGGGWPEGPFLYIGLDRPGDLPGQADAITPLNLHRLIPA